MAACGSGSPGAGEAAPTAGARRPVAASAARSREDLLDEVARLARERRVDYLLIESTGISEPLPTAETFAFEDAEVERPAWMMFAVDWRITVLAAVIGLAAGVLFGVLPAWLAPRVSA